MIENVTVVAGVVSGVVSGAFVIVGGFVTWRLKRASDDRDRMLAKEKEHREELKTLYTSVFVAMEQTISKVLNREEFSVDKDLSSVNARVRLLASQDVEDQYCKVAVLVEEWSALYAKASPRQMVFGEQTVTLLQAPDPTARFKKPAADAHESLQSGLESLIALMRSELKDH